MIVVIPRCGGGCKGETPDGEWLPRQCPRCGKASVIGHGRRRRQSHDGEHDWIRVRRGLCNACGHTVTVLPEGCVPRGQYSMAARQQAAERVAAGLALEQAAPQCRDPDRVVDPATIRRWLWRRLDSLRFCCWLGGFRLLSRLLRAPTLLAWDWRAALLTLIPEASP